MTWGGGLSVSSLSGAWLLVFPRPCLAVGFLSQRRQTGQGLEVLSEGGGTERYLISRRLP